MPWPLAPSVGVLARQGMREFDPARTAAKVGVVKALNSRDVGCQLILDSSGEHRLAIARALAPPDNDLVACEVNILDSKPAALEQS